MACDLRSFSVVEDPEQAQEDAVSQLPDIHGEKIYFAEYTLMGYAMAVCYKNNEVLPVVWREVNFEEWYKTIEWS